MSINNARKQIITYLAIVFIASIPWYILISTQGGLEGGGQGYVLPLMWTPALAGLVTTFIFQHNLRGMGWGLGKLKYYVVAYFLPVFYGIIAYGAVWVFGLGSVDTSALGGNWVSTVLSTLTGGVLMAALLAVGEEIGWRGLLVPQLARINPFARTALISGIIWGIWHIPMIIGGGYSSGAPTWWAIACFMVHITGMAFAFAWLRLGSGSIWPPVLMHAVHNTFIQSILDEITKDTGNTEYFTTEFGLALAVMGVLVGLIILRLGKNLEVDISKQTLGSTT
jgi:membrane protease YdiL (CAAX protease family)